MLFTLYTASERSADPKERLKEEKDGIVLSPQRRSFGTGCHVTHQPLLQRALSNIVDGERERYLCCLISLRNCKILLDWVERIADDKFNRSEMIEFVSETLENIVGKGQYAVYQYFLHFPYYC